MRGFKFGGRQNWLALVGLILSLLGAYLQQSGRLDDLLLALEANQPGLYGVTRFVDGDTIQINMNGRQEKIRMIGVDTPETHKPNTPVQCYGPAAAAYVKNTVGRQKLRLVADHLSTDRDRYDRLLRYVYLEDGSLLNQKIIENGYGFYYPYFPFSKSADFAAAQAAAQKAARGLWANCQPTPTDRGGYESNSAA